MNNHPFHMVDSSPWPLLSSMGMMTLTSGTVYWMYSKDPKLMILGMTINLTTMIQWWQDVIREATFQGMHTKKVTLMMKWGMTMFILSEIMFFSSFFWSFFHSSLSPNMELGLKWPPLGIKTFNMMSIPMLNTMILLSSGMSLTWAHNSILKNNLKQTTQGMTMTIMLGVYFSTLQMYEYMESPFSMSDSIYGSTFFMSTGFHGIHVLIGTMFIMVSTLRLMKMHFSKNHHVGFETATWYWHFVDVVWMMLYISIYWWGS